MNRILWGVILLIALFAGILGFYYVASNHANPHIIEILVGSIALGIIVGIISSLVSTFFRRRIEAHRAIAAILAVCSLAVFLAVLVYSSNIPKSIKREIPVTYLVNLNTKELAFTLHFPADTFARYMEVAAMFKKFRERSTENSRRVEKLLNGKSVPAISALMIFRDLTEYLIPYFIGWNPGGSGAERSIYRKEIGKYLGFPDPDIIGQPKSMDDISGPIEENLFHGSEGLVPGGKIRMQLPKHTVIALERDGDFSSTFMIKNEFMKVTIGIKVLLGSSGSQVLLHPDSLLPPSIFADRMEQERKAPFKRYSTIIYYDVTFSRWRYGFPDMRHYEDWAINLFSALERQFAWGSPILVHPRTLKRIRK